MSGTKYEVGGTVEVLTRYFMGDVYTPDGNEGTWYVVKDCGSDVEVSRTLQDAHESLRTVFISKQRIQGDPDASWRRDFKPRFAKDSGLSQDAIDTLHAVAKDTGAFRMNNSQAQDLAKAVNEILCEHAKLTHEVTALKNALGKMSSPSYVAHVLATA